MTFDEYVRFDALGLADLVRRGEVSAAELLDTAIAQVEALDPALGAVVSRRYEAARAEVQHVDRTRPFCGVPFLAKDLLVAIAGEPTGSGSRVLRDLPMPVDSEMLRRFRQAGLVTFGRTATPEFGLTPYTEPASTGATRNPWSRAHSPGGSSGGSAAAVAAGLVPMASGGDGGGSIRIPASCCGLFGLKPSRGRNPTGPLVGELWHGMVVEHVLSRSVRDSAAALDATAGADAGAPYAAPGQSRPFLEESTLDPGRLRIAFTRRPLFGRQVHADCLQGLDATVRLLQSLGHEVEEAHPVFDKDAIELAFVTVVAAEVAADLDALPRFIGRPLRSGDVEAATASLGLLGRALSAGQLATATRTLQLAARALAPFFARHDLLLTPTLGAPPALIGSLQPSAAELRLLRVVNALGAGWVLKQPAALQPLIDKTFDYIPFTPLFNITGQPAMSVPLHWNAAGLPIGMQFAARFGEEALLFRLAGQLEKAQPWFERRPPGA